MTVTPFHITRSEKKKKKKVFSASLLAWLEELLRNRSASISRTDYEMTRWVNHGVCQSDGASHAVVLNGVYHLQPRGN